MRAKPWMKYGGPSSSAKEAQHIKALLRRGRGYRDMNYLLLKAQRLAATKTEFLVLQKAA
jgi:hypothetical protein